MCRRALVLLSAIACLLAPLGALAQGLDITNPPPLPPREASESLPRQRPSVPSVPGFVAPLSKETPSGRAGVAGWIAPGPAGGSRLVAEPSRDGWLGLGVAIEWGGAPPPRAHN